MPGFEPRAHWWEVSALNTAPPFLHKVSLLEHTTVSFSFQQGAFVP